MPAAHRQIGHRWLTGHQDPVAAVDRAELDDPVQRDQVSPMHPDESGGRPFLLQDGERGPDQVTATAGDMKPGVPATVPARVSSGPLRSAEPALNQPISRRKPGCANMVESRRKKNERQNVINFQHLP